MLTKVCRDALVRVKSGRLIYMADSLIKYVTSREIR
jgi:hypothetical protein